MSSNGNLDKAKVRSKSAPVNWTKFQLTQLGSNDTFGIFVVIRPC